MDGVLKNSIKLSKSFHKRDSLFTVMRSMSPIRNKFKQSFLKSKKKSAQLIFW